MLFARGLDLRKRAGGAAFSRLHPLLHVSAQRSIQWSDGSRSEHCEPSSCCLCPHHPTRPLSPSKDSSDVSVHAFFKLSTLATISHPAWKHASATACSLSFYYDHNPGASIRLSIRVLLRVAFTGAPTGEQAEMDWMLGKGMGPDYAWPLSCSLLPARSVAFDLVVLSPGFLSSPRLRTDTIIPPTSPHRSINAHSSRHRRAGTAPFLVPHIPAPFRVLRIARAGTVEKIIGQFPAQRRCGAVSLSSDTSPPPLRLFVHAVLLSSPRILPHSFFHLSVQPLPHIQALPVYRTLDFLLCRAFRAELPCT
ncbi:hypothetical protein C8J57DRAFT_1542265 [Mycena rebaudengoi]|nr:hypothetical protein C8J57DRAFT_1542265 [Mycena rebaudengoi]